MRVNRACLLVTICQPSIEISLVQVIIEFGTERLHFILDDDWHVEGCSGRRADE